MIVLGKSFGSGMLCTLILCLFCVPFSFADEAGENLILIGGMDGPDPETYPVTETVSRWMQSIIGNDSSIEIRIHDNVVPIDGFSDFYLEALEAGVEKIVLGFYEIEDSTVLLRLASTAVSNEDVDSNLELEIGDDAEVIRFGVDLLNDQSSPPARLRYFTHVMAASTYNANGEYDKAFTEANYAIELGYDIPPEELSRAYAFRGLLFGSELNNQEAALADFDTALELDPTNDNALGNRAYALFEMMRYEEAFQAYNARVDAHPGSADPYFDRALFLNEMGYPEEAFPDFLMAVELAPENPYYQYNLGLCHTYLQDLDGAIQVFNDLLDKYPRYVDARVDRAIIQLNQGDFETAHQNLLVALDHDETFKRTYNGLVISSMQLGLLEDALEYAGRGIELDPTDQNFPKVAGGVYLRLGDFDSALSEFELAYEIIMTYHGGVDHPGSPVDKLVELIDELREISEMDPNSGEYHYARGYQFSEIDLYDRAVEEFNEAIRLDPDLEDAYYMRGLCCIRTGDTEQAADDLEAVISMTNNSYRKRMAEQALQQLTE